MTRYLRGNFNSRFLRWQNFAMSIFCVFLLLFLLPSALVANANTGIKEQFEKKISQLVGVPVSVLDYRMDYSTIHLRGIKVGDPKKPDLPSAIVKELSASCDLMSLLGGNLVLKEITIASLSSRLTIDSSGNLVLGNILLPATSTLPANSTELPFLQILGSDLELTISNQKTGQAMFFSVPSARISRSATSSEMLVDLKGKIACADKGKAATGPDISCLAVLTGKIKESHLTADLNISNGVFAFPEKMLNLQDISADIHADGFLKGLPAKISIGGTVKAPSGQIAAPISATNKSSFIFPFQNMVASFRYSDGMLRIENAQAGLFGGTLQGKGVVYPQKNPISFQIDAQGNGLRSEAFLADNTSQKQVVSGPVSATFEAAGDATGLASWNGKGSLTMLNGEYQTPPVISPFLSLVNLSEFASGDIKEASGTFIIHGGIMTTDNLSCQSSVGKADYNGDVGLDTTLKGRLELHFSQAAVEKSQALKQISLDGRSASIPTKVGGTLLAPSFPGFSTGKLLELGLKRQGQKMLQDLLIPGGKESSETNTSPDQKKKDSGKDLLNDLQNIFKKKKKPAANPAAPAPTAPSNEDSLKKDLKNLFKF